MNLTILSVKDEYGTPDGYLDTIWPSLKEATFVDPFVLKSENRIVKYWQKHKISHIESTGDFFEWTCPADCVVWSNPPFSKKRKIVNRLLSDKTRFLLLIPLQTLATKWLLALVKSKAVDYTLLTDRLPFICGGKPMARRPPFGLIWLYSLSYKLPLIV